MRYATAMTMLEGLRARAREWSQNDPDPSTVAELGALLASSDAGAAADLADRFAGALEFGTAGLRGVLGAGPNRMNRAVVRRTTWGLARYVKEDVADAAARARGVVIGYDGRTMSREFAEDAAGVLAAEGVKVHLFAALGPTPLTAFAVQHLGACAGVMVTASHNPREYNGYKVYWGNGAQIIPPVDAGIARAIDRAPPAKDVACLSVADAQARGLVAVLGEPIERAYLDALAALEARGPGDRGFTLVYTPLHGVGGALAARAFAEAGFTRVHVVAEQAQPDGAFPTVAFPNPEEKGAMDLSYALARATRAELVVANDPDADRLAVAVPSPASPGGYTQLTGNQTGVLLGHYLLTRAEPARSRKRRLVIATIVSSPMLGVVARALGALYEEVLTGFKWIANRAMELEADGDTEFVFGFEEALGYAAGGVVRDKDGISAAVLFAELVASLRAQGQTVLDALEALYRAHGLFVSSQVNITKKGADGAAQIKALMARLRASSPARIGAHEIVAVSDYEARARRDARGGTSPLALPSSNVLAFELAGGSRVVARPSGTEPKIKFYFDVREAVRPGEPMAAAEARAGATMTALTDAFLALVG
jgi:phosphomannomutase